MDSCTVMFTKLYLSDPASGYNKGQLILTQTVHCGDSRSKKEQKRDEEESFNDDANFKWLEFSGRGVGNGSETEQQCCTSI